MTADKKELRRRQVRRAIITAVVAALLGLACRALPPGYQGPCETVINVCTGGF